MSRLISDHVTRGLTFAEQGGGRCHGDEPGLLRPRPSGHAEGEGSKVRAGQQPP